MGGESFNGQVGTFIRVGIVMMRDMEMGRWCGLMGVGILGNGNEGFNMGKGRWCFLMVLLRMGYLLIIFLRGVLFLQSLLLLKAIHSQKTV